MLQYSQDKHTSGYDFVSVLCPPGVVELAVQTAGKKLKVVTPETNRNSARIKSLGRWKQKKIGHLFMGHVRFPGWCTFLCFLQDDAANSTDQDLERFRNTTSIPQQQNQKLRQ